MIYVFSAYHAIGLVRQSLHTDADQIFNKAIADINFRPCRLILKNLSYH